MKTWNPNTNRILFRLLWVTAAVYALVFVSAFWSLPIDIPVWH